jgi:excisionase family DNA binding protein
MDTEKRPPRRRQFKTPALLTILVRSGGRCGICGEQVDPAFATLDHIIPIGRGGKDEEDNCQLAHAHCNASKQARLEEELRARDAMPLNLHAPIPPREKKTREKQKGDPDLLTVQEVAARLRLHEETIRRWLASGRLHGVKIAPTRGGWRIPVSEVERVLRGE